MYMSDSMHKYCMENNAHIATKNGWLKKGRRGIVFLEKSWTHAGAVKRWAKTNWDLVRAD